jgi:hypothetical protein
MLSVGSGAKSWAHAEPVAVATVAANNAARAIFMIEFLPADMQGRLRVAHRPSLGAVSQIVEAKKRQ